MRTTKKFPIAPSIHKTLKKTHFFERQKTLEKQKKKSLPSFVKWGGGDTCCG
jgi:hypothetical protein